MENIFGAIINLRVGFIFKTKDSYKQISCLALVIVLHKVFYHFFTIWYFFSYLLFFRDILTIWSGWWEFPLVDLNQIPLCNCIQTPHLGILNGWWWLSQTSDTFWIVTIVAENGILKVVLSEEPTDGHLYSNHPAHIVKNISKRQFIRLHWIF